MTCNMNTTANKIMKVDDIKSLISTLSIQEIYNSYKSIIDGIFYTENTDSYWDIISRSNNKIEYEKILEFLSPSGVLIDLILKRLTTERSMIHYEFPVQRLSLYTQHMISNNSAPMFITTRLYSKNHGLQNNVLFLNAFEYYFFSFISYIYHPDVKKRIDWNGSTDSIYCQLVMKYLDFFLFNGRQSSTLMQIALQSHSRTSRNQSFIRLPQGGMSPINFPSSPSELIFNKSRLSGKESKNVDIAELYHTETMLQIITEFWLNSVIDQSSAMDLSSFGVAVKPMLLSRPSVDHVCLVRAFLKHCYHFCYAKCVYTLSPDCQIECEFINKLHFYRQQIVPKFLLNKVLAYLNSCFREWPADLTFKIVMETWLSAVQPWRYVDSYQHANEHDANYGNITDDWTMFITDNYELYSNLLLQFTRRLQRMDLAVARNAQMLFRVAKVFGQSQLDRFIDIAQKSRFRGSQDPLWSDIRSQISLVFLEIDKVLNRLEEENQTSTRSWWRTLMDNLNTDSSSTNNPKRVISYLVQAREMFANFLGIECNHDVSRISDRNDFLEYKHDQPDHVETNHGIQLTDFGRFQVANNLCKLNIQSNIDYYKRPVCSYEVGSLVKLCSRTSQFVCHEYADQMRQACLRSDIFGQVSRYFLIGKRRPAKQDVSIMNDTQGVSQGDTQLEQWVNANPIQLRLRFLASIPFLFWFFIFYLVLHFAFNISAFSMVSGGTLLYVIGAVLYVAIMGFD